MSGSDDDPGGPHVSVVLPTLNERAYIRDCLDSLLVQTYPGLDEILVVDGGSTDGTRDAGRGHGPARSAWSTTRGSPRRRP